MNPIKTYLTTIVMLAGLLYLQADLHAGGYFIPHQTARGVGLSNALTAGVNDSSAVYYNPAALSEVEGNNILGTTTYISLINNVENSGRKSRNRHDDNFIASLFADYHIPGSDFTVGIGTYSPFGLASTYDDHSFTRFAAGRAELKTIFITPAIAWRPTENFSIGAGLSYVHASGVFTRALCLDALSLDAGCSTPGGPFEGRVRVTDTANAFTYNVGVLIKPTKNFKLGLTYRGRTDIRFDSADVKFGGAFTPHKVKANVRPIPLPPIINAGLFWQISPSWGAEFVYEHTRWSEFKSFNAAFSPITVFTPLGAPIPGFNLPQRWKNTNTLRLGGFHTLNQNWEIRGGLAVEETPIPKSTLNPTIPDADKLTLNAGLGYKWDKFTLDIGYQAIFYTTRKISNNELEGIPSTGIPFTGAPGKDKYDTFLNFVSMSLGYRF